ncbi:MAG TPA: peptidoglycan editing factor PgeF [Arenimonas sp.]|nr:peptidoglycan editing factor PgeF [Arenimonas sp.]
MRGPFLPADWPAPPGIRALSTLRFGLGASQPPFDQFNLGNCSSDMGDSPAQVAANRAVLREALRLPGEPQWLRQVHGIGVHRADDARPSDVVREADAVVGDGGQVLAILTADCLPVLLCSDDGSAIAAAHAGWRGLAAGVLEATVRAMPVSPSRVLAWLGPAAGPQAYEVGDEVRSAFVDRDPRAASAFHATRPGHWLCDLYALARQRLAMAGVNRIHGGGLCTISAPQRFYSHRRDGRSGRMASLIWRQPG